MLPSRPGEDGGVSSEHTPFSWKQHPEAPRMPRGAGPARMPPGRVTVCSWGRASSHVPGQPVTDQKDVIVAVVADSAYRVRTPARKRARLRAQTFPLTQWLRSHGCQPAHRGAHRETDTGRYLPSGRSAEQRLRHPFPGLCSAGDTAQAGLARRLTLTKDASPPDNGHLIP